MLTPTWKWRLLCAPSRFDHVCHGEPVIRLIRLALGIGWSWWFNDDHLETKKKWTRRAGHGRGTHALTCTDNPFAPRPFWVLKSRNSAEKNKKHLQLLCGQEGLCGHHDVEDETKRNSRGGFYLSSLTAKGKIKQTHPWKLGGVFFRIFCWETNFGMEVLGEPDESQRFGGVRLSGNRDLWWFVELGQI